MCPKEALGVLQLQREVLQGYYTAYFLSTLGKGVGAEEEGRLGC